MDTLNKTWKECVMKSRVEFLILSIVLAELMLITNIYSNNNINNNMLTHENFANESLAHSNLYRNTCTVSHFTGINPDTCIMIA